MCEYGKALGDVNNTQAGQLLSYPDIRSPEQHWENKDRAFLSLKISEFQSPSADAPLALKGLEFPCV